MSRPAWVLRARKGARGASSARSGQGKLGEYDVLMESDPRYHATSTELGNLARGLGPRERTGTLSARSKVRQAVFFG